MEEQNKTNFVALPRVISDYRKNAILVSKNGRKQLIEYFSIYFQDGDDLLVTKKNSLLSLRKVKKVTKTGFSNLLLPVFVSLTL